ncbi:MAG: hypothetical protein IPN76_22180 [Saprospiraceae bacterium]|nr:hypothetical protein [Saprospiraceae bacterium]
MRIQKVKKIQFHSFIILAIVLNLLQFGCGTRSDLTEGITGEKIKRIQPGMKIEQVISILGMPFSIEASNGPHDISCKKPRQRMNLIVGDDTDIIGEVKD